MLLLANDMNALREYAKQGIPPSLRGRIYMKLLNVPAAPLPSLLYPFQQYAASINSSNATSPVVNNQKKTTTTSTAASSSTAAAQTPSNISESVEYTSSLYYSSLLSSFLSWSLWLDDMIRSDVTETCDSENFFIFQDTLYEVCLAFSRDYAVPILVKEKEGLILNESILKAKRKDERSSNNSGLSESQKEVLKKQFITLIQLFQSTRIPQPLHGPTKKIVINQTNLTTSNQNTPSSSSTTSAATFSSSFHQISNIPQLIYHSLINLPSQALLEEGSADFIPFLIANIPPNHVIPFHKLSLLVAPFCFMFGPIGTSPVPLPTNNNSNNSNSSNPSTSPNAASNNTTTTTATATSSTNTTAATSTSAATATSAPLGLKDNISPLLSTICALSEKEALYFTFRAFYVRYFSKLHTLSSLPGSMTTTLSYSKLTNAAENLQQISGLVFQAQSSSILSLCELFERLLFAYSSTLFAHLLSLGLSPLTLVFPWIFSAFSGFLDTEQTLFLWDRILAYDSLELIPITCVCILHFRSSLLLQARNSSEVNDILRELVHIKVIPLLQTFLFR